VRLPADVSFSHSPQTAQRRPEIQGLRAVAALLVAIYHIWLGRVSGGVDVFFVVSAYVVTKALMRQIEGSGRIGFAEFWGKLVRRLLPTAMLVLCTTAIVSVYLLPRPLWDETIPQIIASIFYVENWQLAFDAVDYLEQGRTASPVQHYWALSVQGQFYVLWPIVMSGALVVARRLRVDMRASLIATFGAVLVVSLTYSILATRSNQPFAYFNTFARLWEFACGALLAAMSAPSMRPSVRAAFGWAGLAGIVACGLIFQVSNAFPGYGALWPVGCALLIIVCGNSGSRFGADRLLAWRPFVYLGGISYALYLWHWPILVFYRWLTDQDNVGLIAGLGVLAVATGIAALSTRLVENPLRFSSPPLPASRSVVAFAAAFAAPVLVVALGWAVHYVDRKHYDARSIPVDHPDYPGALAREEGFRYEGRPDAPLYPGMLAVEDDVPAVYRDGCYLPDPQWSREHCVYGALSSPRLLALVGGSHSVHWLPALDLLAKKHGWRIVVYTKSNCLFSAAGESIEQDRWCREWNDHALQVVLEDRPEVLFTTATRGTGPDEHVPPEFLERWAELESADITVVAIRDTPRMVFWVPQCLEVKGAQSPRCAQPRNNVLAETNPVERLGAWPSNVRFIDMTEYFCDTHACLPSIGNIIVYSDDSHVTQAYSRTLAPMLERQLSTVLPPGWLPRTKLENVAGDSQSRPPQPSSSQRTARANMR
jgi:peptidoglycan/LPS O-acetylase OafA/YrhL